MMLNITIFKFLIKILWLFVFDRNKKMKMKSIAICKAVEENEEHKNIVRPTNYVADLEEVKMLLMI